MDTKDSSICRSGPSSRVLALVAAIALAACGKPAPATTASADADAKASASMATASTGAPTAGDQALGAKLNGYTASYNKLIDSFGLPDTANTYREKDIAHQSSTASIFLNPGWLDQDLAALKQARALPGRLPEVDAAADALIARLDKVTARLPGLKVYYDSKAYKDDHLARGKQEDPLLLAEFGAALDALHGFDTQLTAARDRRDEAELAALKARGDMLGFDTRSALKQGRGLIESFHNARDIHDPALFAKTDGLVKTLEATLADQRQATAAAKAQGRLGQPFGVNHEQVATYLTSMVGAYREMKQNHDARDMNEMISDYNNAVAAANSIGPG